MKKFWSIFLGILLVSACEYNPFFGKEKIPERKITGKISLEFSEDPGHVYVWLENTDLITQSLADGSFTMPLPTPGEAGAGTIVSGSYKLYFYSANYQLVSIPLEFFNGEI
ncbi:MAG: hypothetical protein U9N31_02890, partial [Candidatus Marinimicrobia bacterium]|nr:hypothetical protein [Candidatus Neomarinimicrobiota bacterium]